MLNVVFLPDCYLYAFMGGYVLQVASVKAREKLMENYLRLSDTEEALEIALSLCDNHGLSVRFMGNAPVPTDRQPNGQIYKATPRRC
jgi:hypothetical protein